MTQLKVFLRRLVFFFEKISLRKKKNVIIGAGVYVSRKAFFEGHNAIGDNTTLLDTFLGRGSYIGANSYFINSAIGRFCSIGPNVQCIQGNHPTSGFVSTHPAFYSLRQQAGFTFTNLQRFKEFPAPVTQQGDYTISIGNDVWIGAHVKILEGVKIGNGAIIASGALVTKDVEAYSIYGGVPAKLIKYRFNESVISFLEKFQWWDKPFNWLQENVDYFDDYRKFRSNFE